MKRSYLYKRIVVAALAMCMFAMTAVGLSAAYYTDTSSASGSVPFATTPNTTIEESFDGMNKDVSITNTGDTPVVVRFRAMLPSEEFATVSMGSASENWVVLNEDDGWIYYAQPLMPKASTDLLDINVAPNDDAPDDFDIIVFQQYGVAYYDETGALSAQFGNDTISLAAGSYEPVGAAENV